MSVETARHSSIAFLVEKDPLLKTMPNVVLSIHLLVEKNSPASLWEPYINILPHSYNTVLYFTPAQLEGLRGSPVLEDALKQYKFVARQYAYFYRLFSNNMLKVGSIILLGILYFITFTSKLGSRPQRCKLFNILLLGIL